MLSRAESSVTLERRSHQILDNVILMTATQAAPYDATEPEDLVHYGIIPEFVGRFPILVTTAALDEDQLVEVLREPKNAILKQFTALFGMNKVALSLHHAVGCSSQFAL